MGALSGLFLSFQAPLWLIGVGTAVILAGLSIFGWRAGAWRQAAEPLVDFKEAGEQIEYWVSEAQSWLLRFARRYDGRPDPDG